MTVNLPYCAAYVITDMLCLVITIIVASNVSRDSGSERQVRSLFFLLTANMVFVVFDAIWAVLSFSESFDVDPLAIAVLDGINLTAIAFIAYFWFCFTLARFNSQVTNSRMRLAIACIPALAVPFLHVIGYITGLNTDVADDGSATSGPMHIVIALIPQLYLLAATGVALHYRRLAKTKAQRRMCTTFVLFMIAPVAAGIFEILVPNTPVAAAGIIVSIVFVMMSMQESRISNDALTGLNNRRRAEAYLEDCIAHATPEAPVFLFIIDMDRFKTINDTYGHLEGDHALRLMADALRQVCAQMNAFAARWGGDEFVIVYPDFPDGEPETIAVSLQDALDDATRSACTAYRLACSVGFASCSSSAMSHDALIADADAMLYRNKQERR